MLTCRELNGRCSTDSSAVGIVRWKIDTLRTGGRRKVYIFFRMRGDIVSAAMQAGNAKFALIVSIGGGNVAPLPVAIDHLEAADRDGHIFQRLVLVTQDGSLNDRLRLQFQNRRNRLPVGLHYFGIESSGATSVRGRKEPRFLRRQPHGTTRQTIQLKASVALAKPQP